VTDSYQTNAKPDKPLQISGPGVLNNDTDANHDPLTASMGTGPTKGALSLSTNGGFVYTPSSAYPTLQTDSFTYRAYDGKDLSETFATVNIVIDPVAPTVNWTAPVSNGEIQEVGDQFMLLEAAPNDNDLVSQVRFYRWDWVKEIYVDIGVVNNGPYRWNLDTTTLNFLWNQVFVLVRDRAGNYSPVQFIWIYRDLPFQLFMPRVAR